MTGQTFVVCGADDVDNAKSERQRFDWLKHGLTINLFSIFFVVSDQLSALSKDFTPLNNPVKPMTRGI